jgi:hypothetical protein
MSAAEQVPAANLISGGSSSSVMRRHSSKRARPRPLATTLLTKSGRNADALLTTACTHGAKLLDIDLINLQHGDAALCTI